MSEQPKSERRSSNTDFQIFQYYEKPVAESKGYSVVGFEHTYLQNETNSFLVDD